jgi:MOSC domain-containing protein YiiM
VHLIHAELLDELRGKGYDVAPGVLGENLTTRGVDLLALPVGTLLHLGDDAVVTLTGLRNPCYQIDDCRPGVLKEVLGRDAAGEVVRRAGVMAVVTRSGRVHADDPVTVALPDGLHRALEPV